jgi:hypothetical protein
MSEPWEMTDEEREAAKKSIVMVIKDCKFIPSTVEPIRIKSQRECEDEAITTAAGQKAYKQGRADGYTEGRTDEAWEIVDWLDKIASDTGNITSYHLAKELSQDLASQGIKSR